MFMAMQALPTLSTMAAIGGKGNEPVRYQSMDAAGRWRGSAVGIESRRGPRVARLFASRGGFDSKVNTSARAAAGLGAAALVSGFSYASAADEAVQSVKSGMEDFSDHLNQAYWTYLAVGGLLVSSVVIGLLLYRRAHKRQTKEFLKRLSEKPRP